MASDETPPTKPVDELEMLPDGDGADILRIIAADDLSLPTIVTAEQLSPPDILDLGPPTGEHVLPHWTAPATGQVPKVVIGNATSDADEAQRLGATDSLRWRDEHDTSEHGDLMAELALSEPDEPVAERLGALDTDERLSDEAYLNFDDVELDPRRGPRRGLRRSRSERANADPLAAILPADLVGPDATAATTAPATPKRRGPKPAAPAVIVAASEGPDGDPAAPRARRRPAPEPDETASANDDAPASGQRRIGQAAAVGIAMAVVALLAFKAGPIPALLLVEVIITAAGFEYYAAVQRGGFRPATLLGLVAVAAFPLVAYWKGEAAFPMILFLTFAFGVVWFILGVGGSGRPTANLGVTLTGVTWIGAFGAFAALILDIPVQGVSILLLAIVASVGHDVGAFFIGRAMGRSPLTATSPNKTVEGLVGGMLSTLVAVFVFAVLLGVGPFNFGEALVFGIVAAIVAPLGDLAESLFKRDLGIKDMGSLIPQHGGLLDRFDGILFVLPAAYYVTRIFGLS
jgi:phosphatidate cytidylyltransferase